MKVEKKKKTEPPTPFPRMLWTTDSLREDVENDSQSAVIMKICVR